MKILIIFALLIGAAYGQTFGGINTKPVHIPRPTPVIQITVNTPQEIDLYADCPKGWVVDTSSLDEEWWMYSRKHTLRQVKGFFCRRPSYAETMWNKYEDKYWAEQGLKKQENDTEKHDYSLIARYGVKP